MARWPRYLLHGAGRACIAGDTIVEQGDVSDVFYIIEDGVCEVRSNLKWSPATVFGIAIPIY